ncbi:hypothetical protein ACJMK2_033038 [Sinanodonta woodiana]|uniref:Mab-21-like HhH/H2TH-like domain-containing protein n=1 Tax=Sinanodonta woodiana TaxID=1069815 RepID=A0ABD3X3K2_SINWO
MANTTSCSVLMSALLDTMGFSREIIDYRILNTRQRDITGVLFYENHARLITGGKADGTSKWGHGDLDLMFVYKSTIVTGQEIRPPSIRHTVLYADDQGIHFGYTRLRVVHRGQMDNTMKRSLIFIGSLSLTNFMYLSSHIFIQIRNLKAMLFQCHSRLKVHETSGPAHQMVSNGIPRDIVYAFLHPEWPVQASQWANRCRRHGWPAKIVVEAIVQCGCHVVPKGYKGSTTEHLEWCFSFANHEKLIIQLFNLTQKQVYILLKIIANDIKKQYPDLQDLVTTYTMKTVAMWQVEFHHAKDWERTHLLDRLMEALVFLKSCVENKNLPAYFITDNNLFDGKITQRTATSLSQLLNNLLSQGPICVLTFPSIQKELRIRQIPGLRQRIFNYWSGMELVNIIAHYCQDYADMDQPERHILHVLSLIHSPDMARHRSLTKCVSKMTKATLAYINIAKIKKIQISNKRKYELYQPLLRVASVSIGTDRITGRVKFAGVLQVLGKTIEAIQVLSSIKITPLFGLSFKAHERSVISKAERATKTRVLHALEIITRFGRDTFVHECTSLDVVYSIEEIGIVPDYIKYEFFNIPEGSETLKEAHVDPDMLRYYLWYKCYTELGENLNAEAAFISLIRIATNDRVDPHMEFRDVALHVLGMSYMEKKDFHRAYGCFCRAMCLRPRLFRQKRSSSTPWHLAVLASSLINM